MKKGENMKKILITFLTLSFLSVRPLYAQTLLKDTSIVLQDVMGTTITFDLYDETLEEEINYIIDKYIYYDQLGSNYYRNLISTEDHPYYNLPNVFLINESRNTEPVTVNQDLFDMIVFAMDLMEETNGYFNPLIGEALDVWKEVLKPYGREITKEEYDQTISLISEIPQITKEDIVLDEENLTVFLTGHAKLDLGALGKGYATQKVVEYLKQKNITHYQINAGQSSLAFGVHPANRPFNVGFQDSHNIYEGKNYGILKAQNLQIVTSGNHVQHSTYEGDIYHHIINPFDYMPKNYYHSLSITGDDGGMLDAYSTAAYNMELEAAIEFLHSKGIGYTFYQESGVTHNFSNEEFRLSKYHGKGDTETPGEDEDNETYDNLLVLVFILGGVILVFGSIIAVLIIKERKEKNAKEQNTTD